MPGYRCDACRLAFPSDDATPTCPNCGTYKLYALPREPQDDNVTITLGSYAEAEAFKTAWLSVMQQLLRSRKLPEDYIERKMRPWRNLLDQYFSHPGGRGPLLVDVPRVARMTTGRSPQPHFVVQPGRTITLSPAEPQLPPPQTDSEF